VISTVLRFCFFLLLVRPIILIILGLNVRRRELLPENGPAIIVANHNSHLDAITLMTLFGMKRLHLVRPVAAVDYFHRNRLLKWFSDEIIGIIPLNRRIGTQREDPLEPVSKAVEAGKILILFPEGTRGEPEELQEFRTGVAHLAKRHPDVPIVPVFIYGLGKSLPRGEGILVPFFCDIFVGEGFRWTGSREVFMQTLTDRMSSLAAECRKSEWDSTPDFDPG
jgi:1-acyl-sn-glycerol-3-phosphate acyltransferase